MGWWFEYIFPDKKIYIQKKNPRFQIIKLRFEFVIVIRLVWQSLRNQTERLIQIENVEKKKMYNHETGEKLINYLIFTSFSLSAFLRTFSYSVSFLFNPQQFSTNLISRDTHSSPSSHSFGMSFYFGRVYT